MRHWRGAITSVRLPRLQRKLSLLQGHNALMRWRDFEEVSRRWNRGSLAAAMVVLLMRTLAGLVPAARALRANPVEALRAE